MSTPPRTRDDRSAQDAPLEARSAVPPPDTVPAAAARGLLLDDERRPHVREMLGYFLSRATVADFAVRRVRLAALDFRANELRVGRCRVLLGMLDVDALTEAAMAGRHDPGRAAALGALRQLIEDGRLEIRSAGTTRWSPDFAVFEGLPESGPLPARSVCLIGWLGLDGAGRSGPLLTSVVAGGPAVRAAAARFEQIWHDGWDVIGVISAALRLSAP